METPLVVVLIIGKEMPPVKGVCDSYLSVTVHWYMNPLDSYHNVLQRNHTLQKDQGINPNNRQVIQMMSFHKVLMGNELSISLGNSVGDVLIIMVEGTDNSPNVPV